MNKHTEVDEILHAMFENCGIRVDDNTQEDKDVAMDKALYLQNKFVTIAKAQLLALLDSKAEDFEAVDEEYGFYEDGKMWVKAIPLHTVRELFEGKK